ncbi:hypothetical protein [Micromonospora sp. NPDC005313]|uniref:hypothetical protein n=1 Tax=Micromonospora sp. NPDC005313 TaxID=3154296 RepID=UPI00339F6BF5
MTAPARTSGPVDAPPGRLFRHHDFRLLWTGHTVSAVGSNMTTVALPLVAVAVLDASTFQVAVLTAAGGKGMSRGRSGH